jgi:hypothetical protein
LPSLGRKEGKEGIEQEGKKEGKQERESFG